MLLKRRLPQIDTARPFEPNPGFEHVDAGEIALLRWLREHQVDFVLVGSAAQAMHAGSVTAGPLAIVPAPYRRNLERLARALSAAEARVRNEWSLPPGRAQDAPADLAVADLMRDHVWCLCCGPLPMDVVGTSVPPASGAPGASGYQELLYEATRFELTADLSVEVASPEDIEHYAHLRRTGSPPQITISRREPGPNGLGDAAADVEATEAESGRPGPGEKGQSSQSGNGHSGTVGSGGSGTVGDGGSGTVGSGGSGAVGNDHTETAEPRSRPQPPSGR